MALTLLSPEELSARWKDSVSIRTLANWRALGRGPKPTKIGGAVWYNLDEVELYERQNTGFINA